ncbi:uncharacterized protein LOC123257503 [Drosophila ananassae]|uniref:uncharacterized protein LOC123257503 n=1 Tax=Drosophila ananassae TaxID=7217 RepID=UPI001CFFFD0A|nr:uncharacterized protein LOC123257503 [Drosophila ananassae]
MPPLQRKKFNHQQFVHLKGQSVNKNIDSFVSDIFNRSDIADRRSTINPTANKKVRTKDRFKIGSNNSEKTKGHFHLSSTPDVITFLSSPFVASSAALVNATCQAEEGQSSAGSHKTVNNSCRNFWLICGL